MEIHIEACAFAPHDHNITWEAHELVQRGNSSFIFLKSLDTYVNPML